MDPDVLLIRRMKAGEDAAIEEFVKKYYPKILRYCRLKVGNGAEDVTQETFEKFFRTFHRYRAYGKAANYLYVIAANACRDYYRAKRELSLEEAPERVENPIPRAEQALDIERAVMRLPPELRETAILYFFQQRKQREIAEILGIGLPLVKYRVRRARELLSDELRKE